MGAPDDEEPITRTIKRTCYSWIPAMLASAAFICGMLFSFWCESIQFKANSSSSNNNNNNNNNNQDLHFGPWYQLQVSVSSAEVGDGYEQVYITKECVDWQYDPDIDSKWKTTKAFTIMAALLGGFLAFFLWFVPCSAGRISPGMWNGCAFMSAIVLTLFQGLTFLFFRSVACTENPIVVRIQGQTNSDLYGDECSWDSGSTANIISVICWLLTGMFMMFMGLPQAPTPRPVQTQDVTYELETAANGTQVPVQTKVVKGVAIPSSPADTDIKPEEAQTY